MADQEWVKWWDSKIARMCDVSHTFVSSMRPSLETLPVRNPPRPLSLLQTPFTLDLKHLRLWPWLAAESPCVFGKCAGAKLAGP